MKPLDPHSTEYHVDCAGVLQQASEGVQHSTQDGFQEASRHNLRENSF